MTNWKADPVACVLRMKQKAGTSEGSGCTILAGRNEVMSRSTVVHVQETPKGTRYEWGHLFAEVQGKAGNARKIRAGSSETTGKTTHVTSTDWLMPEHANAMADLLKAAYGNAGNISCGGKSLYGMVWDELMAVTDRLMTGQEAEDDIGAARSLAWVIAIMQNPYRPSVDAVREQVMDRWEEENAA